MGVRDGQKRLKKMAFDLSADKLSEEDKDFFVKALIKIADGHDIETALGIKAKRGERKGLYAKNTKILKQHINGWIRIAITPNEEGGLGMTIKEAVNIVKSEVKGLPSAQSLKRYWSSDRHRFDIKGYNVEPD